MNYEKGRWDHAFRRNIYRFYANRKQQRWKPYKDWRERYVDQAGLIMVFQSDSRPDKYAVYFFLPSDEYMHSSCGELQIQDGKIRIETERSIYEFEEDQECLTMAEGLIALENATLYFGEKLELQQDK